MCRGGEGGLGTGMSLHEADATIADRYDTAAQKLSHPGSAVADEVRRLRARKVLVVDDDDVIREVAKVALEVVGGWHVMTAVNGPDAQRVARDEPPDVVLLDVMMPGMDGPRTAASFQEDPVTRAIPIVFLTAKVPDRDSMSGSEPNLVGVIAKPFDPMTLADEISELLGWRD